MENIYAVNYVLDAAGAKIPSEWLSPLFKQCLLTSGVSLNFLAHGLVIGYTSVLLPQLRETTDINEAMATWIASIFGISLIIGALLVTIFVNTYGRKPANIISAALMTAGWLIIGVSENAYSLLVGRFLQGLSMGLLSIVGNILIGECCSPKNRGALLTTISLAIILGVLLVHWLGTIVSWQRVALISGFVAFVDLIIIILSPESPSFYAMRGRYDDCRKAFHWLRGHSEEEELEKLIKINMARRSNETTNTNDGIIFKVKKKIAYLKNTMSKREVYKPVIIMMHMNSITQWAGAVTFSAYSKDILDVILGKDINFPAIIVSLDIQMVISSALAILVIKKLRRKLVLSVTISANVISYLSIALYVYLKTHGLLSFDHLFIGLVLVHIHMFTVVAGALPLPNIIAGEIFPLEHRGFCGLIGILFFSINETINIKSARYLFASIGVHGAYMMYAALEAYFLTVTWFLLPETKDRIVIDIEEEFRGEPLVTELKLMENKCEEEI
ncbi:facilitated trehalose transporter Tret1-like [Ostrinia furnacalis]|uniref:facilitated trehalose transporter Tret1-like n=1 Tax=Ostrinia furnacalis TaxID=93504 RepID=UPI00103AA6A8|nr:facilitated trehalose transporter Tret1-like [Ostrinia furnacalis]